MSTITLDNEPVTFNGPAPSDLKALYQLLSQHLDSQARCLNTFSVDGTDFLAQQMQGLPGEYTNVHATSLPLEEFVESRIPSTLQTLNHLLRQMTPFAQNALSQPWQETLQTANQFLAASVPAMELLAHTHRANLPHLTPEHQQFLEDWTADYRQNANLITSAFALNDPAALSDLITYNLAPQIESAIAFIENSLTPQTTPPNAPTQFSN